MAPLTGRAMCELKETTSSLDRAMRQVVKCLSDMVYRIKRMTGRRRRVVVHFDRMKMCLPSTRLNATDHDICTCPQLDTSHSPSHQPTTSSPQNLEIVDDLEEPPPRRISAHPPPP